MNLISVLLQQLDRSSPGSVETAKQVIGMLNGAAPESALFFGDDTYTAADIREVRVQTLRCPDRRAARRAGKSGRP